MSSNSINHTLHPKKAAVDITTGYTADSFLGIRGTRAPWSKDCFMSIIDAATNHREFFYPLPTAVSAETVLLDKLPLLIASLHKASVLSPITRTTAEQLEITDDTLITEYRNFNDWAVVHSRLLKEWLVLFRQEEVKEQHVVRVREDVQDFIKVFWTQNREAEALARSTGVRPNDLRYAFDVMFRGLQYYDILSPNRIYYFPHPIRQSLLIRQAPTRFETYADRWSWGRLLANLVEAGRIRKDPGEIAQIVASLRVRVGMGEATWYDLVSKTEKEQKEIIVTIAGESALPANVKDEVRRIIEVGLGATEIAMGFLPWPAPLVSVAISILAIPFIFWKGEVPKALGRTRFCRGLLKWPGLFGER